MKEIESEIYRDNEFTVEELQNAVDEDEMNAADAGFLLGAEGGYTESI